MTRKEAIFKLKDLLIPTTLGSKCVGEFDRLAIDMAIRALEQEPNTGHWKAKSFHELFCDNCGFDFDIMRNDFLDKMNYCPNCGAKMADQENENEKTDSD